MKTDRRPLAALLLVVAVLAATQLGCKKDENTTGPGTVTPITDDLFPITVGHSIVFSGNLRSKTVDTNWTASAAVYQSTWLVASNAYPTPVGGTSHLILDTTVVPTGLSNPATAKVGTPLFVSRATATGSANISFLNNIGLFYRTFGIARSDSLRFVAIAKLDAGMNAEWIAFDSTWAFAGGQVELKIVGKFTGREDLTLNATTFSQTYKLELVRRVYVNGALQGADSPTATFWLAANVGPVKMILNADAENYGHYRLFKSKNF